MEIHWFWQDVISFWCIKSYEFFIDCSEVPTATTDILYTCCNISWSFFGISPESISRNCHIRVSTITISFLPKKEDNDINTLMSIAQCLATCSLKIAFLITISPRNWFVLSAQSKINRRIWIFCQNFVVAMAKKIVKTFWT